MDNNISIEEISQLLGASQITIYLLNKKIAELEAEIEKLKKDF
jgi:predicted DNA-binding transcriptional regulator AlpA